MTLQFDDFDLQVQCDELIDDRISDEELHS